MQCIEWEIGAHCKIYTTDLFLEKDIYCSFYTIVHEEEKLSITYMQLMHGVLI